MRDVKKIFLLPVIATVLMWHSAYAVELPLPVSTDERIKIVPYEKNNIVPIFGSNFVVTQIIFGQDQEIVDIQGGDAAGWEVRMNPFKNVLYLKPDVFNSSTDLFVTSLDASGNRYFYRFQIMCDKSSMSSKNQTYALEFTYPEKERAEALAKSDFEKAERLTIVDATKNPNHKKYHWDYSFNGSTSIMPLHVFDDGRFTYFELRPNQSVPAIFSVDNEAGEESVVNYRLVDDYLVVEEVSPQFTLRNGRYNVASIFNNRLISNVETH